MRSVLDYSIKNRFRLSILFVLFITAVASIVALSKDGESEPEIAPHEYRPSSIFLPENGCVLDDTTAIQIAETIWLSIYGKSIYKKNHLGQNYSVIHSG